MNTSKLRFVITFFKQLLSRLLREVRTEGVRKIEFKRILTAYSPDFPENHTLASRLLRMFPVKQILLLMVLGLLFSLLLNFAIAQNRSSVVAKPPAKIFYLMSLPQNPDGLFGPPLPWNPYPGLKEKHVGNGQYLIDDREVAAAITESQTLTTESSAPPSPGEGGGGTNINYFTSLVYGSNDLWLEIPISI